MTKADLNDGYMRLALSIVDKLCRTRIPGQARQVLDAIFRKTFGWQKKEDWIPLSQFVEMTEMPKPHVVRSIKKLIVMNIIIKKDNGKGVSYSINTNLGEWKPLSKKSTPLSKKITSVIRIDNKEYPNMSTSIDIKDTDSKDTTLTSVKANVDNSKKEKKGERQRIINHFWAKYEQTYDKKYKPEPGDFKLLDGLLAKHGYKSVIEHINMFFASLRPYWNDHDRTVRMFSACWDTTSAEILNPFRTAQYEANYERKKKQEDTFERSDTGDFVNPFGEE